MARRGLVVLVVSLLCGCTRVIDSPQPRPDLPVAPIAAGQAGDLLSEEARKGGDGNLFVTVEPARCAGVAREVDAPFVFEPGPVAHDGGHWTATGARRVSIEEIAGVYHANFDAVGALQRARDTIASCRDTAVAITSMDKSRLDAQLVDATDPGAPEVVLWSFEARAWACDNALVASRNAAVEITACSETRGYDVLALAKDAVKRIEALASTTM